MKIKQLAVAIAALALAAAAQASDSPAVAKAKLEKVLTCEQGPTRKKSPPSSRRWAACLSCKHPSV
ncbi:hypothetical protein [Aeromonas veronii]|uniref:hypothetical protein n=1 Tax=Aeromonas veronii TaxID=654 RepID=UPI001F0B3B4A|nr:hypothetical protein [Aeromonas veronii]